MKKKPVIPFRWLPGSWGLSGKVFDEAEAYYLYDGEELERRLTDIAHGDDHTARLIAHTELDHKWGHIGAFDCAKKIIGLKGIPEYSLEYSEMLLAHNQIDLPEYRLRCHEITGGSRSDKAGLTILLAYDKISSFDYGLEILKLDGQTLESPAGIDFLYGYGKLTAYERDCKMLDAKGVPLESEEGLGMLLAHGKIDEAEHGERILKIAFKDDLDGDAFQMAMLDHRLKHGLIEQIKYEKELATIKKEPWIGIIDQGLDSEKGVNGFYFEFDWNDYWIEYLRINGYVGVSPLDYVEQWFSDVCRSQASESDLLLMASTRQRSNVMPFDPTYRV